MSIIFDNAFEKQASMDKLAQARWKRELVVNNPNVGIDPTKAYNTNEFSLQYGLRRPQLSNIELLDAINRYGGTSNRKISDIKLKATPSSNVKGIYHVNPDYDNVNIRYSNNRPNNDLTAFSLNQAAEYRRAIGDKSSVYHGMYTPEELKTLSKEEVADARRIRGYNTESGGVLPKDIPTTSQAPASFAAKLKNFVKANPRLAGGAALGTAALGGYGLYKLLSDD